jgi:thiol-disulfide isomerase/thioredoxin
MKKSLIIWGVALLLVLAAVFTVYQYNNKPAPQVIPPQTNTQPQVPPLGSADGQEIQNTIPAIDFKLKDLKGNEASLSDYKGKTIYVNFWATWCGYCVKELPYIEQLHKENTDPDLVILTVDLQETNAHVSKYMTSKHYTFPVLLDADGNVASAYGIQGIPLSLLIDKDFNIVDAHEGYMDSYETLKDFVNQLNDKK